MEMLDFINQIRDGNDAVIKAQTLRKLKNALIGHEAEKQACVRHGLLDVLTTQLILSGEQLSRQKQGTNLTTSSLSAEEDVLYQLVLILGSIARGGPQFLAPIHSSQIISPLLSLLSPSVSSGELMILVLETLITIAECLDLINSKDIGPEHDTMALLYQESTLTNLRDILDTASYKPICSRSITLVATLLTKSITIETHRILLDHAGILEAVAKKLAPWIKYTMQHPRTELSSTAGLRGQSRLQDPTPPGHLATLVLSISLMIGQSWNRAQIFLFFPCISTVFEESEIAARRRGSVVEKGCSDTDNEIVRQPNGELGDLLPLIAPTSSRPERSHVAAGMPPYDRVKTTVSQWPQSFSSALAIYSKKGFGHSPDVDAPLISWLIFLARSGDELTGLMAMGLLANLHNLRLVAEGRESSLALLIVPLLVRLLDSGTASMSDAEPETSQQLCSTPSQMIKEEAPALLAIFSMNHPRLQKAAVEAGAITKLAVLLHNSFKILDNKETSATWNPIPEDQDFDMPDHASCQMGSVGITSRMNHASKVQETSLIAFAALASERDEYRKSIIEAGVISYIVRALRAEGIRLQEQSDNCTEIQLLETKLKFGHCKEAILAACGAARALSRSVSTLRTSLMEQGLPKPLFILLRCDDIEVQTAATAVISNLALHFSPMRETIIKDGVAELLCKHAHSVDRGLQINSLWALKHLVIEATTEIKMACFEGLGAQWLKDLITDGHATHSLDDQRGQSNQSKPQMSSPNAVGEQVDLLNAADEEHSKEIAGYDKNRRDVHDRHISEGSGPMAIDSTASKHTQNITSKLRPPSAISNSKDSTTSWRPCNRDISIPVEAALIKQGLEMVRNLMSDSDVSEMIDLVLSSFGQDDFFNIIANKLRPLPITLATQSTNDRSSARSNTNHPISDDIDQQHVHPEIVKSAVWVLVHISGSHSVHRQLLVDQTALLELTLPLFEHYDPDVRVCAIWLMINLTTVDNSVDRPACRARALRLMGLGVLEKLQVIEAHDSRLDCQERAKHAVSLINALVRRSRND